MTDDGDFRIFVIEYRRLRLGSMDFEFVLGWRPKLEKRGFSLAELLPAILEVAADPRVGFPLNDLPILLEHAEAIRAGRSSQTKAWGPRPSPSESWDRRMLEIGAIDTEEFNRRQSARKGSAA